MDEDGKEARTHDSLTCLCCSWLLLPLLLTEALRCAALRDGRWPRHGRLGRAMTVLGRKRCLCLHPGPDRGDAPSTLEYKARSRRPYEQPRGAHGVAASPVRTAAIPAALVFFVRVLFPAASLFSFCPPLLGGPPLYQCGTLAVSYKHAGEVR